VVTREQRMLEIQQREDFKEARRQMNVRLAEAEGLVRITKQLVLEGISHREQVLVPELGAGAFLTIRPLSDGEFTRFQQAILGDMRRGEISDINLTVKDMTEREQRGKYLAVSLGLSCDGEEWTAEDVGLLPPGVPDRIYNHIALISGFPRLAGPPSSGLESPSEPGKP
jgi:hypothetical protein